MAPNLKSLTTAENFFPTAFRRPTYQISREESHWLRQSLAMAYISSAKRLSPITYFFVVRQTTVHCGVYEIPWTGEGCHESVQRWLPECKIKNERKDGSSWPRPPHFGFLWWRVWSWRWPSTFIKNTCTFLLIFLFLIVELCKTPDVNGKLLHVWTV